MATGERQEEDEGRFAREGELLVREFERAWTSSGAVIQMDVDSLEKLSLRSAPKIPRGKLGRVSMSSGRTSAESALSEPLSAADGLKEPFMTLKPAYVVLIQYSQT